MSRGRKAQKVSTNLAREDIYHNFKGFYFQFIISQLAQKTDSALTKEDANTLLKKIKVEKDLLISEKKIKQGKLQDAELQAEIIFNIPKNWVWCKLDDICLNITDGTHQTPTYTELGRPFISAQHVKPFKFTPYIYKYVSEEAYQECIKSGKPELGDILVTRVGAIGEAAVIDIDLEFAYYVSTALIQPFKEHVLPKYLEFVINSPYGNLYSKGNISSKGSSAGNFNLGRIRSFLIPLPPFCEQKMILEFLKDFENDNLNKERVYFDKEIEDGVKKLFHSQLLGNLITTELTYQRTIVKKLRQQLLQDAVQGKLVEQYKKEEPARVLLKKIKAEKDKLIAEKKIKKENKLLPIKPEEIPFDIPENWVWCRLGDICSKIGSGSTPKGGNYSSTGTPFFRSQNIYDNGLVYEDIKFISEEVHIQMNGTTVFANDILLNITGGSMGRCALVSEEFEEGNVSQHVCIIRPLLVNNKFYHAIALSPFFQRFIFSSTTGAGREGLPKYNLEQFLIPIPPLSEQSRIVQKIEELMQYCNELEESINQSESQNKKLLQQVLREALTKETVWV